MKETDPFPVYRRMRRVMLFLFRLYLRLKSVHPERIPVDGGCILAPNHVSFLDPPIIGCAVDHRMVHFMARDTLFKGVMKWFLRSIGTIALDRTRGDLAALRKAIQELRSGRVVCLFPEGTRSLDGQLHEAKGGIGFLIAKSGVPVVPVYVDGTYAAYPKGARWIRPGKVRVYFGEPIAPEEFPSGKGGKADYEAVGRLVMDRIAALTPSGGKPEDAG